MKKKLLTGLLTVVMLFGQILPVMSSDDTDISVSEDVITEEETDTQETIGEADDAHKNVRRLRYGQIVADTVTINNKGYNIYADVAYYAQVLYSGKKINPVADLFAEVKSSDLDRLAMELTGATDVSGLIKWSYSPKKNKKISEKAYFKVKASIKSKVAKKIGLKGKALKNFKKGLKKLNKAAKSVKFYFMITNTLDEETEEDTVELFEAKPVKIDSTTFPDDKFREIISSKTYDKDGNGTLDEKEINETLNIYCEGKGTKSIKGVEYFVALQGLWCKDNEIETMDLSRNRDLRGIWCSGNKYTSLDFTPNPRLVWVYCFDCNLKSLNVSNNPKMAYIECNTNPLPVLDVTHNPELEHLT